MPVVHVRIDNRLIHGQIMIAWTKKIRVDRIIVVNEKVAADPMQQTLLKAVAPGNVKVSVLGPRACADYCRGPAAEHESIFIIAKLPEDVVQLVEAGLPITEVNLGNAAYAADTRKVSKTVYLTQSQARATKRLHDLGLRIASRMIPEEPDVDYWPAIEKAIGDWATG
jgi:mannose/fructose/N-acetylgalactosamine-specific phosphotransferase system component IIB